MTVVAGDLSAVLRLRPVDDSLPLKDKVYEALKQAIASMDIYSDPAPPKLDERQLAEQLEQRVAEPGAESDPELVGCLHRRVLRQEAILRPLMRELTDARMQIIR